jgi:hypothetical protein
MSAAYTDIKNSNTNKCAYDFIIIISLDYEDSGLENEQLAPFI